MLLPSGQMKREARINPSILARIVSVVPDRTARLRSGTLFKPPDAATAPIAYLAGFLSWLTPLNIINEEEQRLLGLNPHGKLSRHDDDDDDDHDDSGLGPQGVQHALRR